MEEITHRQLRTDIADVLRRLAAGETIIVTYEGQPAAMIGPPPSDALTVLAADGQLRMALAPPSQLHTIERVQSSTTTAEIVADVQGRW